MTNSPSTPSGLRLAADIGGTFTDIAVFDDTTGKLTTPQRLVDASTPGVAKAGSDDAATSLFLAAFAACLAENTLRLRRIRLYSPHEMR